MTSTCHLLVQPASLPGWDDRYASCERAALFYALHDHLPVFPVNGKIPFRGTQGFKDATTDGAIIRAWWRRWPGANVGIPTGRTSGWLVLDIDRQAGGYESLRAYEAMARHRAADVHRTFEPWPLTRTAFTGGGGLHLIYAYPPALEVPIANTVELAGLPGMDLRGEGGFIVVAPSLHASGRRYRWANEIPPTVLPKLLWDLLALHRRRKTLVQRGTLHAPLARKRSDQSRGGVMGEGIKRAPSQYQYWLELALRDVRCGNRHFKALFLACRLVEFGVSEAAQVMREYVRSVPGGGEDYAESDALKCLEWAERNVVRVEESEESL